jgi:nitrite reductase/ring-hydroxylating ferredoxin subunit
MAAKNGFVRAASLADVLKAGGCMAVRVDGHTLALFDHQGQIYAVDNRCPHMGSLSPKGRSTTAF